MPYLDLCMWQVTLGLQIVVQVKQGQIHFHEEMSQIISEFKDRVEAAIKNQVNKSQICTFQLTLSHTHTLTLTLSHSLSHSLPHSLLPPPPSYPMTLMWFKSRIIAISLNDDTEIPSSMSVRLSA